MRRKFIIDTDAGIDDAHAILMVLNWREDIEVLAITTTHGNTNVDQVCRNVQRLLRFVDRMEVGPAVTSSSRDSSEVD